MKVADYELVAETIRGLKNQGMRNGIALHFAERLHQNNQRFNKDKFLQACGFKELGDEE